jgi:hypothetical protein
MLSALFGRSPAVTNATASLPAAAAASCPNKDKSEQYDDDDENYIENKDSNDDDEILLSDNDNDDDMDAKEEDDESHDENNDNDTDDGRRLDLVRMLMKILRERGLGSPPKKLARSRMMVVNEIGESQAWNIQGVR